MFVVFVVSLGCFVFCMKHVCQNTYGVKCPAKHSRSKKIKTHPTCWLVKDILVPSWLTFNLFWWFFFPLKSPRHPT